MTIPTPRTRERYTKLSLESGPLHAYIDCLLNGLMMSFPISLVPEDHIL